MQSRTKVVQPEVLMEEYCRLLQDESVDALPLVVTGNSMYPFLRHGRDTVYLSRFCAPACRGDILLYRRQNGQYVMHRVHKVMECGYGMLGDAQWIVEKEIGPEQVIAVVRRVLRKNKMISQGDFCWEFFRIWWRRFLPARRVLLALWRRIGGE